MIKSVFAATAALSMSAGAAFAGPYVNIESNSGFSGNDFTGTVLENHIGYEDSLGEKGSWYVQGGPAVIFPDGEATTTELSGKVGASVAVTERVDVYGEVAAATTQEIDFGEPLDIGVKAGVKYTF